MMDRPTPVPPAAWSANESHQSRTPTFSRPWRNFANRTWTESNNQTDSSTRSTQGDYCAHSSLAGIDIYALVDSWRSYKDDTENLQSVAHPPTPLNAAALPFEPAQSVPYYQPYESLRSVHHYARYPSCRVDKPYRISDGTRERQVVEQAKRKANEKPKAATTSGFASRYPVRTNRSQADKPLPSVEDFDPDDSAGNEPSNQLYQNISNGKYRRVTPRRNSPLRTPSPLPPSSTEKYRSQAHQEPKNVAEARKLLVILDLNGTLLYRVKAGNRKKVHMRPGVTALLDYLFSNHVVMVYTSTMPESAMDMVSQFMHPAHRNKLAAIWARDKLDLNEQQYNSKVQVYKKLDKVWSDAQIQATADFGGKWDQSNTVLVDDSRLKALAQPYNLLQVIEYTKDDDPAKSTVKTTRKRKQKFQLDIMKQLEMKLEVLKQQEDVSRLIRKWQNGEISVPRVPGQEVSVEESVDQGRVRKHKGTDIRSEESLGRSQLPTPVSVQGSGNIEHVMEDDDDDEGGVVLSGNLGHHEALNSSRELQIPGLDMLSKSQEEREQSTGSRKSSESSINEGVFIELLGENRR